MAGMELLGRMIDLSIGFQPVDMQTGANTGKRVALHRASAVATVFVKAIGTAGDNPVLTFNQHTAATGGTSSTLAVVDHYYQKTATTPGLVGTETWTRVAQAASATVTLTGLAASAGIFVFPLSGTSLADTFGYVSTDVADTGGNAQLGTVFYILGDLSVQRAPQNLPAALA